MQVAFLGDLEEDSFQVEEEDQGASLVVQVAGSYHKGVEEGEVERYPCQEEEVEAEGSYLITLHQEEEEVEEVDFHPYQEGEAVEEAYSYLEEEGYLQAVADTADRIVI